MNGIFWEGDFRASMIPLILNEIYVYGVYEPFLRGKSGLTIIDAGANIGLWSMYAAPYAKRIIAIEPNPKHFSCLNRLIEANKICNVDPLALALGDHDGMNYLFSFAGNETMSTISPGQGWKRGEEVETCTMKYLFEKLCLNHVDLLKLDIEGGEAAVLRSPEFAEVAPLIDCIVGEWHNWSSMSKEEMTEILCRAGYYFQWLKGPDSTMFSATREAPLRFGGIYGGIK